MPDAELKRLMKTLETAINESLSESPEFDEAVRNIREAGYEVSLVIDATIGAVSGEQKKRAFTADGAGDSDPVRLRITSEDAKFLKSLKIAIDRDS